MKVFVSFAEEDRDTARKLRDDLEKAGVGLWQTEADLLSGQDWKAIMSDESRESSCLLLLLSSASLSAQGSVRKEMKTEIDLLREFRDDEIVIILVRKDECEMRDETLKGFRGIDLFPSYEQGLNDILCCPELVIGKKASSDVSGKVRGIRFPKKKAAPKDHGQWRMFLAGVSIAILIASGLTIAYLGYDKFSAYRSRNRGKTTAHSLRKKPATVSSDEAPRVFELDEKGRPLGYAEHRYKDNGNGTITDAATGLVWQKSDSNKLLTYQDAREYVSRLNESRFAGYDDWRLPNVAELASLLEPGIQSNGLRINPIFDSNPFWFWTSDLRTSGGAWLVDFPEGYVHWFHFENFGYVRAVRH